MICKTEGEVENKESDRKMIYQTEGEVEKEPM